MGFVKIPGGEFVSRDTVCDVQTLAAGTSLEIRPPKRTIYLIKHLFLNEAINIDVDLTDGTTDATLGQGNDVAANVLSIVLSNDHYLKITNNAGGSQNVGYVAFKF